MANNKEMTATTAGGRTKLRAPRKRVAPKHLQPPKSSAFEATMNALEPHLNGAPIASLRMSRLPSLAKKAGLREADLSVFVAAHKLAASTKLPPDAVFALAKRNGGIDATKLAIADASELRNKIASAVKGDVVSATTLASFDDAKPTLGRLQTHDAPIKTLVKNYGVNIPDFLIRRLESKQINTLADIRSVGGVDELAKKLNLKPNDPKVETLVAHAQLSVTGSDLGTNAVLMERGYSRLSDIAKRSSAIFIDKVSPTIG